MTEACRFQYHDTDDCALAVGISGLAARLHLMIRSVPVTPSNAPNDLCLTEWQTLDQAWQATGELIAADPISRVIKVERQGTTYYVKRYTAAGKWLRRYFGRSRPRAEHDNLRLFARLGIPTAEVTGFFMERRWGLLRRAVLITRELPRTSDLARLATADDVRLRNRHWIDTVSRQLADYTARLHRVGFAHNDLKWRNVLVSADTPQVYLIDCPLGRRRYGLLRRRSRIKDLACLDRTARFHLSRSDRLRFFLRYRGIDRLSRADKAFIRKVLRFYDGRDDRVTRRIGRIYRTLRGRPSHRSDCAAEGKPGGTIEPRAAQNR